MNEFKKIGIIYKPDAVGVLAICEKIKNFFFSKHFVTIVSEINNPAKNIDLAIIVGGDGTILRAARFYAPLGVPIFGINMGRLGFLAQVKVDELELGLEKLIDILSICLEVLISKYDKEVLITLSLSRY